MPYLLCVANRSSSHIYRSSFVQCPLYTYELFMGFKMRKSSGSKSTDRHGLFDYWRVAVFFVAANFSISSRMLMVLSTSRNIIFLNFVAGKPQYWVVFSSRRRTNAINRCRTVSVKFYRWPQKWMDYNRVFFIGNLTVSKFDGRHFCVRIKDESVLLHKSFV